MLHTVRIFGVLTGLSLALAGCGYKGALDKPPEAAAEATIKAPDTNAPNATATPKKPFILDPRLGN